MATKNVKFDFSGQVAVITGGGSGIGRGVAEGFAKSGANIVIADVNEKGGEESVALCEKYGVKAIFVKTDVGSEEDSNNLFKETIAKLGRADFLILVAGTGARGITGNPMTGASESDFDICYHVNLMGIFFPVKAFYDYFKENRYGKIVTYSSIAGTHASPHLPHYSTTKAAAIQLTKILAIELGPFSVNVNCVCPGYVDTPIYQKNPKQYADKYPDLFPNGATSADICNTFAERLCASKRPQTVEDMANCTMFLCSDAASEIMGQIVEVSGGFKL